MVALGRPPDRPGVYDAQALAGASLVQGAASFCRRWEVVDRVRTMRGCAMRYGKLSVLALLLGVAGFLAADLVVPDPPCQLHCWRGQTGFSCLCEGACSGVGQHCDTHHEVVANTQIWYCKCSGAATNAPCYEVATESPWTGWGGSCTHVSCYGPCLQYPQEPPEPGSDQDPVVIIVCPC